MIPLDGGENFIGERLPERGVFPVAGSEVTNQAGAIAGGYLAGVTLGKANS
ncbi:hypothetical protein NDI52_28515 [Leptolyngbya sp. PL-A3]|uniref:hypothetical protein n=1 Tax=Leptolyngbya sp. PL-A3 TaxID=2933911 RepID=UPI003298FE3A